MCMNVAAPKHFTRIAVSYGADFGAYVVTVEDGDGVESHVAVHVDDYDMIVIDDEGPAADWVATDFDTVHAIAERFTADRYDARCVARHGSYADV